jgi:hypothetical protein
MPAYGHFSYLLRPPVSIFSLTPYVHRLIIPIVAKYRIDSIANLARQLTFTPVDPRATQLNAAELLLHELAPDRAYPLDFVVYRITGYQP